jgi:heptosyltransferase-2
MTSLINGKAEPGRILIRGVNWLGDSIMTMPALARLRERFPKAHIAVQTQEKLQELWHGYPLINEVIVTSRQESVFTVARRLRSRHFDLAIIFPNSPRSALEAWLARIPRRVGYARGMRAIFLTDAIMVRGDLVRLRKRSAREIRKLTERATPATSDFRFGIADYSAHHVHDYLYLASIVGANPEPLFPQLNVSPQNIKSVADRFSLKQNGPLFALNVGAEYGPAKRWPAEHFAAVAREVQANTHCTWVIIGGEADVSVAGQVESALGCSPSSVQNLAGKTTLSELQAVLAQCHVLLTNDTGPMHVAAALGVPVVVPFGSTSPRLTGPTLFGGASHRLIESDAPCAPCFLRKCPVDFRCMRGISVQRVAAAVQDVVRSHVQTGQL